MEREVSSAAYVQRGEKVTHSEPSRNANASAVREPKVRKDGRCARKGCIKMRPIVTAKGKALRDMIRYAGRPQLEADPFCSNVCARVFYGCPLDNGRFTEEQVEARSDYGRRGKDAGPLAYRQIKKAAA